MSRTEQLSPAGSFEREDPIKDQEKAKTRRPPNTAFRQQRLKAWQPILTPKTVLPLLFVVGVIFAPLGGLLLYSSAQVQEVLIDYTSCNGTSETPSNIPSDRIQTYFTQGTEAFYRNPATWQSRDVNVSIGRSGKRSYTTRQCTIQFFMPEALKPPVYMYYQLTNFYQNHRRYVQSYSQDQLMGKAPKYNSLATCDPLNYEHTNNNQDDNTRIYYPCGLIANSIFNDTISEPRMLNVRDGGPASEQTYSMTTQGTAWATDAQLYRNGNDTGYNTSLLRPPPFWEKRYPDGYNDEFPVPDLKTDEVYQNWMRTAGLPTFVKLYRRNDNDMMQIGRYAVDITYDWPADKFGGTKSLMISTRTVMGGRNPSLGIAYIVIAGVCVLLGAIFTVAHLVKPRKLGDHAYLTWNNDKPSTATTTGRAPRPHDAA